jgi:hypothetical protein
MTETRLFGLGRYSIRTYRYSDGPGVRRVWRVAEDITRHVLRLRDALHVPRVWTNAGR